MEMKHIEDFLGLVISRIKEREKLVKTPSYYNLTQRLNQIEVNVTQQALWKAAGTGQSLSWPVTAGLAQIGKLSDKDVMSFIRASLKK